MSAHKKKEVMGRTIVVIDKATKAVWTKAARKADISNSEYVRRLIKAEAERTAAK
jgi:hypothetical protein